MAGWSNFNGTRGGGGGGGGGGRGAGGRGFNRHYSDQGGSGSGGGRWGPAPPQFQYRPVDATRRQSQPVSEQQAASSTSSRNAQRTHPTPTADKSPASVTAVAPSRTREPQPDEKGSRNAANFECNVCFDMAAEPVVTKCGHLFCWECLYQWLHVHSNHRECPVCKGQVADDAIIPIYGRGGSAASVNNAPPRPTGARVESSRQQQQPLSMFPSTMYLDDDEEDPFDLPGMMNFGFGATSLRDAVMSFMPSSFGDVDYDQFDDYTYEYDTDDFDEVYDYNWLGFPVFAPAGAEAGNPSSLQAHADMISARNNVVDTTNGMYHQQEAGYSVANPHNRGRRRRNRARPSADHSSTNGMVMGGSGALYRDHGASSSVSAGSSSRPSINWVERRGRSNRNSNSAVGRGGMQDSRRQRTNYN